ncbi:uncharacterized protein [Chelonus insularis]|uniref:uncharacterized protein n=1 Tax=Chelonus insularis TaxID=460826 RepID=UPI001589162B|nr:uncharacterized protein LOC118073063 [Chelonus insularis]
MEVIFDFWVYVMPPWKYRIKEFTILYITKSTDEDISLIHGVFLPPYDYTLLENEVKEHYKEKQAKYGIPWEAGNLKVKSQKAIISDHLVSADVIYVRNTLNENILNRLIAINPTVKVIALEEELGYDGKVMKTYCQYHDDRDNNYCTTDNSKHMYHWLKCRIERLKRPREKSCERSYYVSNKKCINFRIQSKLHSHETDEQKSNFKICFNGQT